MHVDPIDPEIILVGVLPPLLYSAAVSLPAIEFRRDFRPIAGLSVLLVLVSAVALGLFFFWAIPDLGLALAIGLGAILSPTDAVATTIAKRLGISPRVITMRRGRKPAQRRHGPRAAAHSGRCLRRRRRARGGAAIGASRGACSSRSSSARLVGYLNLLVRERVSPLGGQHGLSFVVPFVAYLPTEHLGGSGLVAAVVAGIVTGQGAARRFTPEQRLSDELNWRTIELMLEGAVFLVMGLELKEIVAANMSAERGSRPRARARRRRLPHPRRRAGAVRHRADRAAGPREQAAEAHGRDRLDHFAERVEHAAAQPPGGSAPPSVGGCPATRSAGRSGSASRAAGSRAPSPTSTTTGRRRWAGGTARSSCGRGCAGVVTLAAAQTLPADAAAPRTCWCFIAFLVAAGSLLLQGIHAALASPGMLKLTSEAPAGPSAAERARDR